MIPSTLTSYSLPEKKQCNPKKSSPPKTHEVKCWPEFWEPLKTGQKSFELRRNDRKYQVGDSLIERQWNPSTGEYVGFEELRFGITFVLKGPIFGLRSGYCILGLTRIRSGSEYKHISEEKIASVAFAASHHVCDNGECNSRKHNMKVIADAIRDALA